MKISSRCKILQDKSYQHATATPERVQMLIEGVSLLQQEFAAGRLQPVHAQTIERLKLRLQDMGVDIADLPEYRLRMTFLDLPIDGEQRALLIA